MRIRPAGRVRGSVRLPGDKSITHRAAILAALADGRSQITNFSTSEDCLSTLRCLQALGVPINRDPEKAATVTIGGVGTDGLRYSPAPLDCGNSGTTMRMLAGVLAGQNFTSMLTGDDSLRLRPMRRIITPLEMMGAQIEAEDNHAPLRIAGRRPLRPITYEMPMASAQVKSAVLLAGLNARGRTEVVDSSAATRDHTERMLGWFGVQVETRHNERGTTPTGVNAAVSLAINVVALDGPSRLSARDYAVPGDISSAAFFLVAAAMLPDSHLELRNIGLNPTRAELLSTLRSLGAQVRITDEREECREQVGNIIVSGEGRLAPEAPEANVLRGSRIPGLIDELPVLAVLGTQTAGGLEIRDATELRVKESDRISTTVENLRLMGARVEEYEDGLRVWQTKRLHGATLNAHSDHRIAMAFAVAALVAEGETEIIGAECAAVSFPEFFALLESVIER